jgi:hypothetical protein
MLTWGHELVKTVAAVRRAGWTCLVSVAIDALVVRPSRREGSGRAPCAEVAAGACRSDFSPSWEAHSALLLVAGHGILSGGPSWAGSAG